MSGADRPRACPMTVARRASLAPLTRRPVVRRWSAPSIRPGRWHVNVRAAWWAGRAVAQRVLQGLQMLSEAPPSRPWARVRVPQARISEQDGSVSDVGLVLQSRKHAVASHSSGRPLGTSRCSDQRLSRPVPRFAEHPRCRTEEETTLPAASRRLRTPLGTSGRSIRE